MSIACSLVCNERWGVVVTRATGITVFAGWLIYIIVPELSDTFSIFPDGLYVGSLFTVPPGVPEDTLPPTESGVETTFAVLLPGLRLDRTVTADPAGAVPRRYVPRTDA